jgi:hypothetical protein
MRKVVRIAARTLLVLLVLLAAAFAWFWFIYLKPPAAFTSLDQSKLHTWYAVPLGDSCQCSDGSAFNIYISKGNSPNLLINFSGGGACWDDTTASHPMTYAGLFDDANNRQLQSFYIPRQVKLFPKMLAGLADNGHKANPFYDWNVVYIPYCTGDLHIGHASNQYNNGKEKMTVHHNGRTNVLAALNWVYRHFGAPKKVLVSGESAGAYASAFWAPAVASHYRDAAIFQLSDASMWPSGRWPEILDSVWKSESSSFLHVDIGSEIYEDALLHRNDSVKNHIRHLYAHTVYDEVLPRFSAQLNHLPVDNNQFIDQWSADTRATISRLAKAGIDYHYFVSNGFYNAKRHSTPHTITNRYYYNMMSDGLAVADWLRKCVIEDKPVSVGGQLLSGK